MISRHTSRAAGAKRSGALSSTKKIDLSSDLHDPRIIEPLHHGNLSLYLVGPNTERPTNVRRTVGAAS